MNPENEDLLLAQLDYAVTPMHVLALSELNLIAFTNLREINDVTFRANLDLLAELVPPSCAALPDAHTFVEDTVRQARRSMKALDDLHATYERRNDGPLPLVGKVGMIKMMHLARRRRGHADGPITD